MKILHIIESLGRGGAERLLVTTIRHFDKDRFDNIVCYLCDMNHRGSFLPELREMGIKTYFLGMKNLCFSTRALMELVSIIKHEKIDIVHTHLFGADIYGRVAGRIAGAHFILSSLHNPDYQNYSAFPNRFFFERRRLLDKFTGRLFNDSFIAVSKAVKRSAEKYLGFKGINVIYNSIDPDEFKPLTREEKESARISLGISKGDIAIVTVGRLHAQKGHTFLLRALKDNRLRGLGVKLLLMGEGPLENSLKEEVKRSGLQGLVIFLGSRKDVRSVVGCSDIFVLPSIYEGFGIGLLEAMALRVPCISSDIDGIKEIITNNRDGILVEPACPAKLSEAVLSLMSDPVKRSGIIESAYANVCENFNIRRQIKLLEEVYLYGRK